MFKRLIIIIAIFITVLFANSMTRLEYDMDLIDYLTSNTRLSDEEIAYLNEHSTLIYGADYNSPPLRYVNESTQQYEGMVIDYLRTLSLELGIAIEFKPMVWSDALDQLSKGQTDICDMYKSEERAKTFLFSNPIYYQRGAILVHKSNTEIQSVKDLEGRTIAGSKGDYVFEYIDREFDSVTGIETADLQEAIGLLTENQIDAVLGDESVMNHFITKAQLKNEYIILDDYLYEREAVLGVHKDNAQLIGILNKAISNLNKKRTMEMIYQKWFGLSPLITKSSDTDKTRLIIEYVLAFIALFIFSLYIWNLQLKKEVRQRTDALKLSKNELETVFNGLTHLMLVIDETCALQNANRAFCNIYNVPMESIRDTHCNAIHGILGTDCSICPIRETFEHSNTVIKEIKDRNRIYKVSTYLLDKLPHSRKRILVVMEDVTDFKLTERSMLQSTKMAAVGQLAAGIAHEIRTPLGIIRNNLYFMRRSPSESDKVESMDVIESSVERANRIIDNLLNFSRLTDNRLTLTNINGLILNIYDLSRKAMKNNRIQFALHCPEDTMFIVNSESLKHVMINLINNAIDAMPDGGDLDITVSIEQDCLMIFVTDTGIGMDQYTMDDIFNPFYTTKELGSGTGLGLYICYNEIQKMGGVITVESTVDAGTTFSIVLPRLEEESRI